MTRTPLLNSDQALKLAENIKNLIENAKESVISKANSELVMLNWSIGKLIKLDVQKNSRADYGEQIVATLSRQLSSEYGK